jgi:hypothetical protein
MIITEIGDWHIELRAWLAQVAWAMMAKGERYKEPVALAA